MSSEKLGKELQALYESCLADGLTQAEIRHAAGAFVSSQTKRRRSAIVCTAVVLFLLLLRDSIEWRLCMCARLLMIALLPYWNWTPYHYVTCLVDNPFFSTRTISTTDCQVQLQQELLTQQQQQARNASTNEAVSTGPAEDLSPTTQAVAAPLNPTELARRIDDIDRRLTSIQQHLGERLPMRQRRHSPSRDRNTTSLPPPDINGPCYYHRRFGDKETLSSEGEPFNGQFHRRNHDRCPYEFASLLQRTSGDIRSSALSTTMVQVCEDLRGAVRVDGFEPQALLEDFVDNLVPLVVSEDMSQWPSATTSFALTNVTQAYLEDQVLKEAAVCNFRSNRRLGFDAFLRSFTTSSGWFAHWENCDRSGQKHLRQFYRRPSFLPLAVELTRPNWVIASRGFSGRRFKQLDFEAGSTLVWFAQVKGLNYIRLVPESVCSGICQELELLLDARDILLVHTSLWRVHYLPGEDSENIAFAAGCFISE
ncbi:uncharacterized protein LOC119404402 [Rhipicephalus sanguineus]|uniref:uncharacterized protein LOC119404402 n=1 Tax=Rhipicephalus sanguineus TaxID=34632 RepID=UPI0020C3F5D5|nr:uncharacterized protein LOC119404402 [Rhipicephalus sanguineus]